jgi:phosphoglycolate phosphatase
MAVRTVVFDLDGTLVDTLADIGFAMNQALDEHGHPKVPLETYRGFLGSGAADLARRATPDGHPSEPVLATFRERYAARLVVASRPYEGIEALLASLASRELRLAVLSNKPDAPTRRIVHQLFPGRFVRAYGQRDEVPKKPDPSALLGIAEELGVRADELAMVGDSGVDVTTARNAGALAVGVTWGYRPEAELVVAGAHHVIAHPSELLARLG